MSERIVRSAERIRTAISDLSYLCYYEKANYKMVIPLTKKSSFLFFSTSVSFSLEEEILIYKS